ncbi:hypothetical protein TorRG33x02_003310, partial [Trema orientale]
EVDFAPLWSLEERSVICASRVSLDLKNIIFSS